jgi:dihydrofolate synthase / folylpolyglutamate synthase
MFKNATEAISYIESMKVKRKDFKYLVELFNKYDNFQNKIKTIHVAGTNGKGSTTNFIRSIIQNAGYKVGTFTSPYLEVHNDRIRINNVFIPDQDYLNIANHFYDEVMSGNYTFFEIDTLIGFYYLYINKVDYAVIEVGMGGRLDATNVIKPLISVITNIGFDHMEFLGDTIEKIAYEKAGIVKQNTPLVVGCNNKEEALNVFKTTSLNNNAEYTISGKPTDVKVVGGNLHFIFEGKYFSLKGEALYQAENASLAIKAVNILKEKKLIKINDNNILEGVKNTFWLGRFELVNESSRIYLDGAHNTHGIEALSKTLQAMKDDKTNIKILFAALTDKETDKMVEKLIEITADLTATEFDFHRCKKAMEIANNHPVSINTNWKDFINNYIKNRTSKDILVITGSLYFITQVRHYLKNGDNKK